MEFDKSNLKPVHLKLINALADLKGEEFDRFLEYVELVNYKQNDLVFRVGDTADCMLLILQGQMRVTTLKTTKKPYFVRLIEAGQSLGEISMIDGGSRSATIEAAKDSLVLKLDARNFEKLIVKEPHIASRFLLKLSVQLCAQLRDLTKRITNDSTLRDILPSL